MKIKDICEQITSVFENGTTKIQYDYAQNLKDGRGITCGKAGFCTGTGDAIEVVTLYSRLSPKNPLEKYIPALEKVDGTGSVKGLTGFQKAWKESCKDSKFLEAQDSISETMYWKPSQRYIRAQEFRTNIAKAVFYDTIIQHGESANPDGFLAILQKANEFVDKHLSEGDWLKVFLLYRKRILSYSFDKESREVWAGSVSRCDSLLDLLDTNPELKSPIIVKWEDDSYEVK